MDTGPVLGTLTETVRPRDTSADLLDRLAVAGAELLVATLDGLEAGRLDPVPQPPDGVSRRPQARGRRRPGATGPLPRSRSTAWSGAARRRPAPGRRSAARGSSCSRSSPSPPGSTRRRPRRTWRRARSPSGAGTVLVGTGSVPVRLGAGAAGGQEGRWRRPTGRAACGPSRGRGSRDRSPARAAGQASGSGGPGGREAGRARRPRQRSKAAPSQRSRAADPARDVAFEVLRAVREDDAYANLVLPVLLRRRGLDARDAGARHRAHLRHAARAGAATTPWSPAAPTVRSAQIDPAVLDALRLGAHQLLATRVPAHAAVSQTVGLVRDRIGSGPGGFRQRRAATRRRARRPRSGSRRPSRRARTTSWRTSSVRYSHPAWVVRALREALVAHGRPVEEIDDLLAADNLLAAGHAARPSRPGRAWPSWSRRPTVPRPGGGPRTPWCSAGRPRRPDRGAPEAAPGCRTRAASWWRSRWPGGLAARRRQRRRGAGGPERWLDLCAGPGGKAALLAARAAQEGAALVAVEVSEHRAELVRGAVGPDVEVRTADGRDLGEAEPGAYDRVLVDAPCTGLGALRRRPEARWRRQPSDLADARAAAAAAARLRAGRRPARRRGRLRHLLAAPGRDRRGGAGRPAPAPRRSSCSTRRRRCARCRWTATCPTSATARRPSCGRTGTAPTRCSSPCCAAPPAEPHRRPVRAPDTLASVGIQISPSILSSDFADLRASSRGSRPPTGRTST